MVITHVGYLMLVTAFGPFGVYGDGDGTTGTGVGTTETGRDRDRGGCMGRGRGRGGGYVPTTVTRLVRCDNRV